MKIQTLSLPSKIIYILLIKCNRLFPNKFYIKLLFRLRLRYKLDLQNPVTFCEKIQWLKLYNQRPEYTQMVDKAAVKDYVGNIIGKEYIIPTIGIWGNAKDIDFEKLPNQFVLKTTRGGGSCGVIICKDKKSFNYKEAISQLNHSMKQDLWNEFKEWPYKNVHPHILAEKYLGDGSEEDLKDYKFFCFNGKVKFLKIDLNRFKDHHANFYDRNWILQNFREAQLPSDPYAKINQPQNFQEMLSIAEKLSANIPFVRVDLYNINGTIYFGELTFFPASGFSPFIPSKWDKEIGNWLTLPQKKIIST